MGGFVPLPSPYNPYAAMAEGFASSAAHAYNAAQEAKRQKAALALRTQQQQQARDQTAFQNQLRLHSAGAIPAESQTRTSEGFIDRTQPNPDIAAMGGGGQTVTDPGSGQRWYIPTEANKAFQKRQAEGFTLNPDTALGKALISAGWDGKRPVTPAESHSLMMALNEAAPKDEPFDIDTSGKFLDAQGNPVPVIIGKKTGSVRQIDLSGAHAARTQADAAAQGGIPGNDDPFATSLLEPAEPTASGAGGSPGGPFALPEPSLAGAYGRMTGRDQASPFGAQTPAAPAQRTPAKTSGKAGGGLSFRPAPKAEKKETADDWIRIKTDPKSPPDEVKRATAALAEYRSGQTEADKDRHQRQQELEADRAERKQERADAKAEKQTATFRGFERDKKKAIDAAIKNYRKATQGAVPPELKKQALDELRSDLGDAQREYKSNIESETGQQLPDDNWWQTYDPEAPGKQNTDPGALDVRGKGADPGGFGVRKK